MTGTSEMWWSYQQCANISTHVDRFASLRTLGPSDLAGQATVHLSCSQWLTCGLGTNAGYMFAGHSQPEVTFRANAIKTTAKGARTLHFADGSSIDIAYPAYYMRGEIQWCSN